MKKYILLDWGVFSIKFSFSGGNILEDYRGQHTTKHNITLQFMITDTNILVIVLPDIVEVIPQQICIFGNKLKKRD